MYDKKVTSIHVDVPCILGGEVELLSKEKLEWSLSQKC